MNTIKTLLLAATASITALPNALSAKPASIHDCSQLQKPDIHQNICSGAKRFADGINKLAKTIIPGSFNTTAQKFTFYEHLPDSPHFSAQTPNPCLTAFTPSFSPKLHNPAGFTGGGAPLCNMLTFVQSAQGQLPLDYIGSQSKHKQPITYFNALIDSDQVNNYFGDQHGVFAKNVKHLGAYAVHIMSRELPQKTGALYYPDPPYVTKQTTQQYHGISGGGGSGAGFEIFIIYTNKACIPKGLTPSKKNPLKVAIFTGGFGGGGGMSSPDSSKKLSAGAGGGGGLQFTSGLGLGAGSNHTSKHVQYSYNAGSTLASLQNKNQNILNQYLHHLEPNRIATTFNIKRNCISAISVEGGGGMGAGFELLNAKDEEYAIHAYSSEGGFQFKYRWHWAPSNNTMTSIKRVQKTEQATLNADLTPFYKAMGGYWAQASQHKAMKTFKRLCQGGWGRCPNCLYSLQNYSIFCKAQKNQLLSFDNIPNYMLIDYPTGPKTQCPTAIKPLDKKTTRSEFNAICQQLNQHK